MNFLIVGDGPQELAWARALLSHPEHRLAAACPGFKGLPDVPGGPDFDAALAVAGVDAAIVGGEPGLRAEALRRVAGAGLPVLCLHPPGPDADAYYQVALSRQETGAVVAPDLPARLHPGVAALRKALDGGELGTFREIRYEGSVGEHGTDLLGDAFPRVIDVVRALLGEVAAVTTTGDPPGDRPSSSLVVQLRGPRARRAEVRLWAGPPEPSRLIVAGSEGTLTLEHDPGFFGASRLVRRPATGAATVIDLPAFDPSDAILDVLASAAAGRDAHPDLLDGTRAMEITEAARRSLRRGRTVDLHYEEVSELGNFKSVMTSLGCLILIGALLVLPLALAGPAFGARWTIYIAYAIPPLLVLFALLQLLRFAARGTDTAARRANGQAEV
jgi:myo-inositol 2-dehydrogenase/D-chiro-inositol 1-dehydrogenase